ncbi:MAG: choice-of-anchor Q domain-containing protein [Chloroflexota bacterium]
MRNVGNNTLIYILIFLIIALLALIGFLFFVIYEFSQPTETEATIYLVDASERMTTTFSDTDIARFDVAQRFLREHVSRLPDEEITSLQVFGSGANTEDGCLDTESLVPPSPAIEAASDIILKSNDIVPQSRDAALVRGAVEALTTLANSLDAEDEENFNRKVKLYIVTSGQGTCDADDQLIQLTANQASFDLEVINVIVDSDREDGGGVVFFDFDTQTIELNDPTDIEALEEQLEEEGVGGVATSIANIPTAVPPALSTPTFTPTVFTPTASATSTPPPTNTPIPTSTFTPPPPTNTPDTDPGPNPGPTNTATVPVLNTPTPGTPIPSPTLVPATNTPVPSAIPPTQPPVQPTSPPAATSTSTPVPTNTPTPSSGSGGGSTATFTPSPTNSPADSPVTISDVTVVEGASGGIAVITVERLTTTTRSLGIFYQTEDGTATSPADYKGISGELDWAGSEGGSKTISVEIEDDAELEGTESFSIRISNKFGAEIQKSLGTITIQDDERGEINVSLPSFAVSEAAGQTSTGISLNSVPSSPVTIRLTSNTPEFCTVPNQSIVLTSGNWSNGLIEVGIVNNGQPIPSAGQGTCQIITAPAESTDLNFNGIDPVDLSIVVYDDDAQYVDKDCSDNGNGICSNGVFFKTISASLVSPIPSNEIYVLKSPHVESNVNINRNVSIIASNPGSHIIQAAAAAESANGRIFTIASGLDVIIRGFNLQNGFNESGDGGAISNQAELTLDNVTFTQNVAGASGGAIFNTGVLNIVNGGQFLNNTARNGCGGAVFNSGTLVITNDSGSPSIDFLNNTSSGPASLGGGICNTNGGTSALNNILMSANRAAQGGAIYNQGGIINLENSTLAGNRADEGGSGNGGGIFNAAGTINVQSSTLTGNYANQSGGGIQVANGASVRVLESSLNFNISGGQGGGIFSDGDMTIQNSTVSTNQASGDGGALYTQGGAISIINGSTLANNSASAASGIVSNGNATLLNTILANPGGDDCTGTVNATFSLILNPINCTLIGANNVENQSPALNDLSDNGGQTLAHVPSAGSPAINAGDPNNCTTTDQWGRGRPQAGQCDMGAVEQ